LKDQKFIYGLRPVIEAIKAGKEIEKIFIQNSLKGEMFLELKKLIHELKLPYQMVPMEKLNRLIPINHQGVICYLSPIDYQPLENILPTIFETGRSPLILLLDRITDVRNFGAIARTAECAGVDAIVIPTKGAAQINADAIKTSAGALHKINVCRTENLRSTIDFLQKSGLQVVACTEKTDHAYHEVDYTVPLAFIMGSEEDGISNDLLNLCDAKVNIPLSGEIESLNVSVAFGIIIFEAVRQRTI